MAKCVIYPFFARRHCFCVHPTCVHVSSAGSRYWQSGSFEVSKSDTEAVDTQESMNGSPHSAVRVTVLSELEGVAYIQVTIRDSSNVGIGNGKIWTLFNLWSRRSWHSRVQKAMPVKTQCGFHTQQLQYCVLFENQYRRWDLDLLTPQYMSF